MTQARAAADEAWERRWCGLVFRVEQRRVADDSGTSLRIGPVPAPGEASAPPEWLRFDCFEARPHWHVDPAGRGEVSPLDERGDPVAECIAMLETGLVPLLARAGAPAALCEAVDGALGEPARARTLRAVEAALRHRPAQLDALDLRTLENRRSEKWHTYPRDVLPAWVAEMDFPIAAPIARDLARFVASSDVGYPLGLRQCGLAEAFCERMAERFDWAVEPDRVEILSEVVQGLHLALAAFSAPGDGAIVQTPIYPPFLHAVRDLGRRLVENRLVPEGDELVFDLDGLARTIDAGTRVLLLCHPHNPTGHVASRAALERLAELVLAHDLVVVADEIHADLIFDGARHLPFAALSPEIARRTVTLTSASKAFNIPGLRCAVAHFGSAALQARFAAVAPKRFRGGLGLFGLAASATAWRFGQPWLDEVVPYLQAQRDFARDFLAERIPAIRFYRPRATYLAWLDCAALGLAPSPAAHFLRQARVALSDGRLFGDGYASFVRLNFATSRPILQEILERMARSLEPSPAGHAVNGRPA